ncbi:RluA family pseudouridine synthase [Clostridium polynesiense]|uniref:RluA family pseudouridine synthase n=1 Tax=Clostridium polynesiense TaxID=1325933 RepID=UPI0005910976|nr:RluA family pseudouridine synthase [Clostridium polynesiense]
MSVIKEVVKAGEEGSTIRNYLKGKLGLSTRLIRGASKDGRIKVNGSAVRMNYIIKPSDVVVVELSKAESQDIEPEKMPLSIVYENEDILVVNKPPYMVCHPTRSHQSGTLANGVLYYFKETNQSCIVRLVNRLDMNTSGLVIIAKNQYAHMFLSREMQGDSFRKKYKAIVHGKMEQKSGTLDLPIYRPTEDSIKRIVDHRGQRSVTHYKVLEAAEKLSLVELELETGRTHQIRVHLSYIGHPIAGDTLYGIEGEDLIERQALHAYEVEFPDPKTSQPIILTVDIPEDMKELLRKSNIKI